MKHYEYISTDTQEPLKSLLKQLKSDIGDTGSVVVWFKAFEKGRNKEMALLCPEHKEFLEKVKVNSELFFGQAKRMVLVILQKKQKQIIEDFKDDKFPVLIATSVAEEGLDIPSVDLVIFYEAIPSAIRTVQRRGRTGRHARGRIITLITKNTRDEAFKWVSHHKEKRMYRIIDDIKKNLY